MEEGQPGSSKDFNRTGNPAIGTLSWQSFQERDPTGYRKLVTLVMRDSFTSALAVMISYVGGHLQDPSQISYVCGLACGDALKMLEEKGLIRSDSAQDQANPSKTKQV